MKIERAILVEKTAKGEETVEPFGAVAPWAENRVVRK